MQAIVNRWGGLFAMLGSLLWTVGWIIVSLVGGGTHAERVWRTLLLNPAMVLFLASLAGFQVRQAGRSGRVGTTGFVVCLLGTGTMLLGNIGEFWVSEYFWGTQTPGWVMMGVGLTMLPAGFVLLGIGTLRAGVFAGWRRAVPLGFGVVLALIVILVAGAYWTGDVRLAFSAVYAFALGWAAFGYALWSANGKGAWRPGPSAG
jgi:hypothetical protein